MNRAKYLLIAFLFCNLTWQILVWGIHFLHPVLGVLMVFLLPVFLGIAVYVIFPGDFDDDWAVVFFASGVLFPIFYFSSYATRAPEYVEFVYSGYQKYAGKIVEIQNHEPLFYELTDFAVKDAKAGEFGASYSSSSQKSSTTYAKHFVVPLFDKNDSSAPRAWLFGTYKSGSSRIDNGDAGYYGFDRTSLGKARTASTLYAKKVSSYDAERAVAQYLKKMNLPAVSEPLVLEMVDEPAESYYRRGKIFFWIWTGFLNMGFMGFSFYISGKTPESDKI
jgi:hypothetical protein